MGCGDYVMPDLMRIGGVTGWLRSAAIAGAAGIEMSTHLYPEFAAHLMRVTETAHWLEWQDWADPILAEPFSVSGQPAHDPEPARRGHRMERGRGAALSLRRLTAGPEAEQPLPSRRCQNPPPGASAVPSPDIRKGMPSTELSRETFEQRFKSRFIDPAFAPLAREIQAITDVAWDAYSDSRKAPHTRKAGPGFADPDYDLSVEWLAAHDAMADAQRRHENSAEPSRILIVNGSSRSEHTCPGEMSKTWRLVELAQRVIEERGGFHVDILDLSRTTSEFGKIIYPCKSCVSTAMPLCHWPCSCYPNHALGQNPDWMNEIYPVFVAAHGVMIITPVNWYQAPGSLKAMMDRLVCADGGNPDPTSTHGKNAEQAKALELAGWPFPRHLGGRLFAAIVHADFGGRREPAAHPDRLGERHAHDPGRLKSRARPLRRLLRAVRHEPRSTGSR